MSVAWWQWGVSFSDNNNANDRLGIDFNGSLI